MMRRFMLLGMLALLFPGFQPANADDIFAFSYSGAQSTIGDTTASVTLSAVDSGPQMPGGPHIFLATTGQLTLTSSVDPASNNKAYNLAGPIDNSFGNVTVLDMFNLPVPGPPIGNSPSGAFIVDNVLFPTNPTLDNFGLLFTNGAQEISIFGNVDSSGNLVPDSYSLYSFLPDQGGGNYIITSTGSFTPSVANTPEPTSLFLMGGFIVSAAARLGWQRRKSLGARIARSMKDVSDR